MGDQRCIPRRGRVLRGIQNRKDPAPKHFFGGMISLIIVFFCYILVISCHSMIMALGLNGLNRASVHLKAAGANKKWPGNGECLTKFMLHSDMAAWFRNCGKTGEGSQ